jgi:hypothetical protein
MREVFDHKARKGQPIGEGRPEAGRPESRNSGQSSANPTLRYRLTKADLEELAGLLRDVPLALFAIKGGVDHHHRAVGTVSAR